MNINIQKIRKTGKYLYRLLPGLLLLCLGQSQAAPGDEAFLQARDAFASGNPFIFIPIAHGYFYIVYILTVLQLAVQKKMSLRMIIALVAAGTIPVASFIAERTIVKKYS